MHDDLPVGLLELAARVDEGKPIDWDAEERAAADDDARAVIQGFRVLASVAAVAQDDSFDAVGDAAVVAPRRPQPERHGLGPAASRGSGRPRRVLAGLSGRRSARPSRGREAAGAAPRRRRSVRAGPRRRPPPRQRQASEHRRRARRRRARRPRRPVDGVRARPDAGRRGRRARRPQRRRGHRHRPGAVRRARRRPRQGPDPRRRQGAQRDARGGRPRRPHGLRRRPIDGDVGVRPRRARRHAAVSVPRAPARRAADRGHRHLQPRRAALSPGHPGLSGRRRDARRSRSGAPRRPAHALRDRRPICPTRSSPPIERAHRPRSRGALRARRRLRGGAGRGGHEHREPVHVAPKTVVGAGAPARRRSLGWDRPRGGRGAGHRHGGRTVAIGRRRPLAGAAGGAAARFQCERAAVRAVGGIPAGARHGAAPPRAGARIEPAMALAFELEASRDVYVYIVNEDEQGRSYALFPTANTLQNPLAGGVTHVLPGGPPWEVDSTGGQEHLFVIVSPTPVPEIADAVAALPPATGEPRSDGNLALNTRGIGSRRRASARDAARPGAGRRSRCCPVASRRKASGSRDRPEEPLTSARAPPPESHPLSTDAPRSAPFKSAGHGVIGR